MDDRDRLPQRGLTIGELATVAGVSTRTIRHYHAVGLLAEPERDASGYRRYRAQDVVSLVRVVRLRALGMPIPRIADQLADPAGGTGNLSQLAAELAEEIAQLTALHDRLVTMSEQAAPTPAEAVAIALRAAGRLAPDDSLAPAEANAVELVDALHPAGVAGVVDTMSPLLADPARATRLAEVIEQVRQLSEDDEDEHLDRLVAELVAVLPKPEPGVAPLAPAVLDKLLDRRLTNVQRRFQLRMRAALDDAR